MQQSRSNIVLAIIGLFIITTVIASGQKTPVPKPKRPSDSINLDSLVAVTIAKNDQAIQKRIGELKHAEKAVDSFVNVVSELKQENIKLYEQVSFNVSAESDTASDFNLLPISEDKDNKQ